MHSSPSKCTLTSCSGGILRQLIRGRELLLIVRSTLNWNGDHWCSFIWSFTMNFSRYMDSWSCNKAINFVNHLVVNGEELKFFFLDFLFFHKMIIKGKKCNKQNNFQVLGQLFLVFFFNKEHFRWGLRKLVTHFMCL